jgi:hypothetical protein
MDNFSEVRIQRKTLQAKKQATHQDMHREMRTTEIASQARKTKALALSGKTN